VLGWPEIYKLAHAFLCEYSYERLELAQLLGQLGVILTCGGSASTENVLNKTDSPTANLWRQRERGEVPPQRAAVGFELRRALRRRLGLGAGLASQRPRTGLGLGFGRIVVSNIEAPNILANLV
jgi:hypothetical protein